MRTSQVVGGYRSDDVLPRFAQACRSGDTAAVRAVLTAEAIAVCDGIGVVYGRADVAWLAGLLLAERPRTTITHEAVNGRPGLALRCLGRVVAAIATETAGTRITALWIVLDPAKLRAWHRD
ncbi:siderophore-interacting protein [Actinoplanes sp. GCM10030250]|uniref:siderophore-interacting protein n=1 Tax=Actinoplanes sp. GCM10030250 TaxID=3273376 RepID=UPI00361C447E